MINDGPFAGGVQRGRTAADYFRIVAHHLTRYQRLSFGAKGMHVLILGLPPDEVITEEGLAGYSTDGVKTVRKYLGELQAHGFLVRGERMRYPAGTVNAKGKPIGGALGPYRWFATDQLEEVTAILEQRRLEQDREREETAGQNYRPDGEVGSSTLVDNSDLPAREGGSSDQAKQGVFHDHNYLPEPPVGMGSSSLEEPTTGEEQEERGAGCAGEPDALRLSGPETSTATSVSGPPKPEFVGDPLTARGREASSSGLQWHGAGSLSQSRKAAAQHELNTLRTRGRPAPSWKQQQERRRRRDPQRLAAAQAELEQQRQAGPRRAPVPSPPASRASGGVIPPEAAPPPSESI